MPRVVHQPPKYARHKSTKQAVVYYRGQRVFLGPHGSAQSHHAYRRFLHSWNRDREQERITATGDSETSTAVAESITEVSLREKRLQGEPVTISELILVYRRQTYQYYRKNGVVTREAEITLTNTDPAKEDPFA